MKHSFLQLHAYPGAPPRHGAENWKWYFGSRGVIVTSSDDFNENISSPIWNWIHTFHCWEFTKIILFSVPVSKIETWLPNSPDLSR